MEHDGLGNLSEAADRVRRTQEMLARAKCSYRIESAQRSVEIKRPSCSALARSNRKSKPKGLVASGSPWKDNTFSSACASGNEASVQRLMKNNNPNINAKSPENGRTPLMLAAIGNHTGIIDILLTAGASVNERDDKGSTALHHAARYGSFGACRKLVLTGASPNLPNQTGITALHIAVQNNAVEVLAIILKDSHSVAIDLKTDHQLTALMIASSLGHPDCVRMLLHRGANVAACGEDGLTALHHTVLRSHPDCARLLISHDSSCVDATDDFGRSALALAATDGNLAMLSLLVSEGNASLQIRDTMLRTPLLAAIAGDHSECVTELIVSGGQDVNEEDSDGLHPLHVAAQYNAVDSIQILLDNKAAIDCKDSQQETPIMVSVSHGSIDACKVLIEHGANVTMRNTSGHTALHKAARNNNERMCDLLISADSSVTNIQDSRGETALYVAAADGHHSVVRYLCDNGADTSLPDNEGSTAIAVAAQGGYTNCVRLLLGRGANADVPNKFGRYPIHEAAYGGHIECLRALLVAGADENCVDDKGVTPLLWATVEGHSDACEVLVEHGAMINTPERPPRDTSIEAPPKPHTALDYALIFRHGHCATTLISLGGVTYTTRRARAASLIQYWWRFILKARAENASSISEEASESDQTVIHEGLSEEQQLLLRQGIVTVLLQSFMKNNGKALYRASTELRNEELEEIRRERAQQQQLQTQHQQLSKSAPLPRSKKRGNSRGMLPRLQRTSPKKSDWNYRTVVTPPARRSDKLPGITDSVYPPTRRPVNHDVGMEGLVSPLSRGSFHGKGFDVSPRARTADRQAQLRAKLLRQEKEISTLKKQHREIHDVEVHKRNVEMLSKLNDRLSSLQESLSSSRNYIMEKRTKQRQSSMEKAALREHLKSALNDVVQLRSQTSTLKTSLGSR